MPFFAGIHVCKGKHRHDICQSVVHMKRYIQVEI